jgi:hypothetical protein
MNVLIAKYLQQYTNLASAGQISERWCLTNEQYSWYARSTVRVIRAMLPDDMAGCTDDEIIL